MKTLNWYIARQLASATGIGVLAFTFIVLMGNALKVFSLISRGMPVSVVFRFLLYLLPAALGFAIPLSLLCATVLVFSRLSADNEITAMRALGVNLWEIAAPGQILAVILSAVCLFLLTTVKPRALYRAYLLQKEQGSKNPEVFLTEGVVELPGYIMYIGRRRGRILKDLDLYVLGPDGRVVQDVTAHKAELSVDLKRRTLILDLFNPIITARETSTEGGPMALRRVAGDRCRLTIDFGSSLDRKPVTRKLKYMSLPALFAAAALYMQRGIPATPLYLEINTRLSMGLSPIAFLLIGIPFGIRTRRSETAVGLAAGLLLAILFYAFIVLAETLKSRHGLHPELLVWAPNLLYQIGGIAGLHLLARR